jgi:hypothetical protein
MEGKNPYASTEMVRLQQSIHFPGPLPVLMWNPPWILLLLAPILWMNFENATTAWLALNIALLAAIPFVVAPCGCPSLSRGRFLFLAVLTLLFFPVLDTIKSGQLGVLLAFGVALVLRGLGSGNVFTGGVGFAILSVKPHLAVMMGLALLFRARVDRSGTRMLLRGGAMVSALVVGVSVWRSNLVFQWLHSLTSRSAVGTSLLEWRTDTITSFLRELSVRYLNSRADFLVYLVPLLFVGGLWLISRARPTLSARALVGITALVSPAFAPYGWVSDYSLALPALLALFLEAGDSAFRRGALAYLLSAIVTAPFFFFSSPIHRYVFLLPLLMGGVAWTLCAGRSCPVARNPAQRGTL